MSDNDNNFKGMIKTHYLDSTPWWPEKKRAPEKAPNILYILLDDTGYADIGCYGSLIDTPNIDKLAEDGLRYRDFHVNAMCSPTRASLLSGCNNHAVGMGYLANYDLGFPAYRGRIDPKYGYISEALKENGYNTFVLGKWHLVNDEDSTGVGPYDQWPLSRGFDKFYGFLSACTNQYYPALVRGNEFVDQPKTPDQGYHVSEDITDKAIKYIGDLKSNDPDKPFFCYLAFGAQHCPLQAPKEYIDRYKGRFGEGWDIYRQKVFEKQKKLGLLPENTVLSGNDRFVKDWDSYTDKEKRILARYMEVYAGFLTHTDAQIGRVIAYLKRIGQYENTMILFLTDNGASPEGTEWGTKNYFAGFFGGKTEGFVSEDELEDIGSENSNPHYPRGWAHASNTPLKLYKTWTHNGGVKVPLIITYPERIKDRGGIRPQYHHVTDIYKTVLEVCGIEEPEAIKGVRQEAKHGVSMTYSFDNPEEPTRRHVQYYEMLGNRGIWAYGWKAVCDHAANPSFDITKDVWELYHTESDFSETNNLAEKEPEKLREMIDLWWYEAGKYGVLPLLESHMKLSEIPGPRSIFRFRPVKPKARHVIYPEYTGGTGVRLPPNSYVLKVFARYKKADEGVLVSGGDNQSGFALYVLNSRLRFHNNWLGSKHTIIESDIEIPEGDLELSFEYIVINPGSSKGHLLINGRTCGTLSFEGRMIGIGGLCIGRFPKVSVVDELRGKGHYPYTNFIDRAELVTRPPNDQDKTLEMEREASVE
jgi:arylsulfatase A-like enzyme